MGIFASSVAGRRPESCTTADIFRSRGLRTLFSPPSKAEILGSAPSSRFPKWSIVFECLSCLSRRVGISRGARKKSRTPSRARISPSLPGALDLDLASY